MKVFVNGSFDVLHTGHLDLLNYAKSLGDFLHVALDSDRRISEKKGPDRPFNNENNRTVLMTNIKAVNQVSVFDSDEELINIIKQYITDFYYKITTSTQSCEEQVELYKREASAFLEKIKGLIGVSIGFALPYIIFYLQKLETSCTILGGKYKKHTRSGYKRSGYKRSGHKRSGHKRSGYKRSGYKRKSKSRQTKRK